MDDALTPEQALQKILDALSIDDLDINSRGLFEGWIRQSRPLPVASEVDGDANAKIEWVISHQIMHSGNPHLKLLTWEQAKEILVEPLQHYLAAHLSRTPSPVSDQASEILDNDPWPECGKCGKPLWKKSFPDGKHCYEPCVTCEPGCRPEPVSVSLEAMAKLFHETGGYKAPWEEIRTWSRESYIKCIKAVLDAAGVKYVE